MRQISFKTIEKKLEKKNAELTDDKEKEIKNENFDISSGSNAKS